jgi:hypothetical protein
MANPIAADSDAMTDDMRHGKAGVYIDVKLPLADAQALDPNRQNILLRALAKQLDAAPGALELLHISEFGETIVIEIKLSVSSSSKAAHAKDLVGGAGFRQQILKTMEAQKGVGNTVDAIFGGMQFAFPQHIGHEMGNDFDFRGKEGGDLQFMVFFMAVVLVGGSFLVYGSQGIKKHHVIGQSKRNRSLATMDSEEEEEMENFDEDSLLLIDD